MTTDENIPFKEGDWILDQKNPSRPGQFTGRIRRAGPYLMAELRFPDGSTTSRPLNVLELMQQSEQTLKERLIKRQFGRARDLQRVVTYEKLKGTLHEVIYSMEAAQIDFYPYQFKPVLKIINSPTERLIIADEVGLGKTIESALIWLELQARKQAKRLLVVCPRSLADKWRDELSQKFQLDARVVNFKDLQHEVGELHKSGPSHSFVLIGTYSGLRPPKKELRLLTQPPDEETVGSAKTEFLRELTHSTRDYETFDLVIFDEAHYMRNPATTTFNLGKALSENAGAVLCVSATPINNSNVDLQSLLRLVDESFFESQHLFSELLTANSAAVRASNALERIPVDEKLLQQSIEQMHQSPFIKDSPLFKQFVSHVNALDPDNKTQVAKCQGIVENLNLLGSYVNRTRRVQVKEDRPIREPRVLTVEYSAEEMSLYNMILGLVRQRCRRDSRPFHVFQVLGLQLRAASCLPALAQEIQAGRFGDITELMSEALGEESFYDMEEDAFTNNLDIGELVQIVEYDFELNDSKYAMLKKMLGEQIVDEKVIIFAYYRPTLAYLQRRLVEDGITVTVIHGGVSSEQRWIELDRFEDPQGPRVLLSSEVGSEGIDLQFCRVVVNYDLPWNPMRVEQRIGRIDRIGQKAKKLLIINFKVRETVEERLYVRLHEKLARFTNSLGDLEAVIGHEIQQLTVNILSKELSIKQEEQMMEQTQSVIEKELLMIEKLEESGDSLLAISDYLQRQVDEVRGKGRYMQADELEDYVSDFFERNFPGCELNHNTPQKGCFRLRLTHDALVSLSSFIRDDKSISARPFRQREFQCSFRRDAVKRLNSMESQHVHFVNHLSPLVRWITQNNQADAHTFFNVSALILENDTLSEGTYIYYIERWTISGLSNREQLSYAVIPLGQDSTPPVIPAEEIIQLLLHEGKDWDRVDVVSGALDSGYAQAEHQLQQEFDAAAKDFHAEDATALQIREQRVRSFFDKRIREDEQRVSTLKIRGQKQSIIRMAEGRIASAQTNKETKLNELQKRAEIDMEQTPIAAGVFRVEK